MASKFLKIKEQNMSLFGEFELAFARVLNSGNYISGSEVQNFEAEFARVQKVEYSIACNSGTSALYLSLMALDIGQGDEVIVPGMTFIATIEAVVMTGATPVVVDVDEMYLNLNVSTIEEALSPRTRAVVFVHLHGNTSGIIAVTEFCKQRNINLIEDAAQAHLSAHSGISVGNFGDVAAFSFYPGKNLGAIGEGGCVTTNKFEIAEKVRLMRNWGSRKKYVNLIRGGNYRMDELQAAFLSVKLKHIERWTGVRRDLASEYIKSLKESDIQLPEIEPRADHVFHIFAIRLKSRDDLARFLHQHEIETGIHYPVSISEVIPWQPHLRIIGSQKISRSAAQQLLSLPISESHPKEEINFISSLVRKYSS